ncbi:MAG: hypothetical protein Q7T72_02235, partial [Bacteroidales bacterium]|nr:hypothetical protein [Bacteroidales bacterium]
MFDYFKINNLSIGLRIQDLLDFERKFNERTGEILNKKKSAIWKNLIITITTGPRSFVKLQGSLHRFANNGELNNDRFTFERFIKEVAELLNKIISPDDLINVLEFGVNIKTPFNPSIFVKNVISYGKTSFNKTIKPGMVYSSCEKTQYIIKIYDKGLQQGPEGSFILRIEAKYLKMENLFKSGLKWSDLSKPKTWFDLGAILEKKFSEVVYFDPSINLKQIPETERLIIEKGHNPIFWENLSGPHASRIRKHYQNLIKKHGIMFKNLPELLNQEINEVVNSDQKLRFKKDNSFSVNYETMVNSDTLLYR